WLCEAASIGGSERRNQRFERAWPRAFSRPMRGRALAGTGHVGKRLFARWCRRRELSRPEPGPVTIRSSASFERYAAKSSGTPDRVRSGADEGGGGRFVRCKPRTQGVWRSAAARSARARFLRFHRKYAAEIRISHGTPTIHDTFQNS